MTEDILGPFAEMFDPKQVMPMVVYLCSEQSELTHEIFSVGGGRYARVFIGTNTGWFAGQGVVPSVEELSEHLEEVRDVSDYVVPGNNNDELMILAQLASG
jgi:hypothetical protein